MARHLRHRSRQQVERLQLRLEQTSQDHQSALERGLRPEFSSIDSFLAHLTIRSQPTFFVSPTRRVEWLDTVRQLCPKLEPATIAAADQVCQHQFDLLGSGPTDLGQPIDWHVDFKTGHRFDPNAYYADIEYAASPGGFDIKVPWELSRCQHFVWLGQAYWFTGNETYAQEFVAQTLDWITHNPPKRGVNWVSAMDVAIRSVNWLWAYHFFQDADGVDNPFRQTFFNSLVVHGRHIRHNLEYSETHTNNHYLSNLVGLVYLGILLPELKEADSWRELGMAELEREMIKQVYADGMNFEASTAYHRLATEMFLSTALLAKLNDYSFSSAYLERLERMLEFVLHLTKPDGTSSLIGDNDNGRLHRLQCWADPQREWVDYRYLLAIGAELFGRADFAQAAGDQFGEAVCFFGAEMLRHRCVGWPAIQQAEVLPDESVIVSRGFSDAGLYVLRHQNFYLAVDAGSVGQNGNGGHAHNDLFSFELAAHGLTWIIDPGTLTYTADYGVRNRLRSTTCHSTVMVDQTEQNRFDPQRLFRTSDDGKPGVLTWLSNADYDLLIAEHQGYHRLPESVTHQRSFYVDKTQTFCWLEDQLKASGQHRYDFYFSLHPAVKAKTVDAGVLLTQGGKGLLLTWWPVDQTVVPEVQFVRTTCAPSYGQSQEHQILQVTYTVAGPFQVNWLLYPLVQAARLPSISTLEEYADRAKAVLARPVFERL